MAIGKFLEGTWGTNYHVATVATLTPIQADVLLFGQKGDRRSSDCYGKWIQYQSRDLFVTIDYPLDKPVEITVNKEIIEPHGYPSLGVFLLILAKEYERIYKNPKKYGVEYHGINDLYFERVTINRDGYVELFIGS